MLHTTITFSLFAGATFAQVLNIPEPDGSVQTAQNVRIEADVDFGNQEWDSNVPCVEVEGGDPVFIVADGVTVSNLIIGPNQIDGIHCEGRCRLLNVWFRDVCEDAITALGGDVLVQGGGANGASDKVIQHDGPPSTVIIRDYTVTNSGKLYRSCGNCSNNGGPRRAIISNVQAFGIYSDLAGININFGDRVTIDGSCATGLRGQPCQQYQGLPGPGSDGPKVDGKDGCGGSQGKLTILPDCASTELLWWMIGQGMQ